MNIKDKKVTFLVIIGIAVIIAIFIFAFTWREEAAVAPTINQSNNNSFENINATNATLESDPTEDMTEEEISEAKTRDTQRLEDIDTIKSALGSFLEATGYYPDTIDELVPDYITVIPSDPMSDTYEYSYTCIGSLDPCLYYDLSYTLEVGTEDLPAGLNLDSPEEIASP